MESILRGIRFAAKQEKVTRFSTIYLQLDNTGSNKCVVVIFACCLLVALGVAKNMKINFLEVGHTHEDIDALIGLVVMKLRVQDLPILDSRVDVFFQLSRMRSPI